MERPNTVSGLEAKKAELFKLRDQLEADLRSIVSDIDHLEGAIGLFDKTAGLARYVRQYWAKKGLGRCAGTPCSNLTHSRQMSQAPAVQPGDTEW